MNPKFIVFPRLMPIPLSPVRDQNGGCPFLVLPLKSVRLILLTAEFWFADQGGCAR
jgi:hypothetical protein